MDFKRFCFHLYHQRIFRDGWKQSWYTPKGLVFLIRFYESHCMLNRVYFCKINFISTLINQDTFISCKWLLICSTISLWSFILYYKSSLSCHNTYIVFIRDTEIINDVHEKWLKFDTIFCFWRHYSAKISFRSTIINSLPSMVKESPWLSFSLCLASIFFYILASLSYIIYRISVLSSSIFSGLSRGRNYWLILKFL